MAGINFKKLQTGDPLPEVTGASYHNALRDALKWVDAQRNKVGQGGGEKLRPSGGIILIQNNSGSDRDRFEVLGLDVPAILPSDSLPSFQQQYPMKGVLPVAANHVGRFAITLEGIPSGQFGYAMVSGVTPVQINLTAAPTFATETVIAGAVDGVATHLEINKSGAVQVLWCDTAGSYPAAVWAIVRFSGSSSSLVPFELYRDCVPSGPGVGATDVYFWPLKADYTRDDSTSPPEDTLDDGVLGDVRAYGSAHSGFTTGAKGFYTPVFYPPRKKANRRLKARLRPSNAGYATGGGSYPEIRRSNNA